MSEINPIDPSLRRAALKIKEAFEEVNVTEPERKVQRKKTMDCLVGRNWENLYGSDFSPDKKLMMLERCEDIKSKELRTIAENFSFSDNLQYDLQNVSPKERRRYFFNLFYAHSGLAQKIFMNLTLREDGELPIEDSIDAAMVAAHDE